MEDDADSVSISLTKSKFSLICFDSIQSTFYMLNSQMLELQLL